MFVYPSSVENDMPSTSKSRTLRCPSTVNCGTPASRIFASMSGHME